MNLPCGCCEGIQILTPQSTANRPGLGMLAVRVGTHATFLETMLARLSSAAYPELAGLKTRDPADPAIALLDAWATVADVLTFYQERIANEGYLRTAVERRSILELARLVGYKLRPGVSASVYLAYTLENGSNVEIPAGARAQSVPNPGEQMESFETSEPLQARADWNALQPRLTRPQSITAANADTIETLYFEGIATNLNPNDVLLIVLNGGQTQVMRRVKAVEALPAKNRTKVTLQIPLTAAALAKVIQQIVARYQDIAAFCVSPTDALGRQVIDILDAMQTELVQLPRPSLQAIARLLLKYLTQLQAEHNRAIEGASNAVATWIDEMVADLQKVAAAAQLPSGSAFNAALVAKERGSLPPLTGLMGLLPSLAKPPSLPPANSLRLGRDIKKTFEARQDTLPQLIAAFRPDAASTIYPAWANSVVTRPAQVEIYALRVKAAPFGHNAPLKPVLDDKGRIVATEEWPIGDTATIDLVFENRTERATISIRRGDELHNGVVALSDHKSHTVRLGPDTVSADVSTNPDVVSYDFKFEELGRKIVIQPLTERSQTVTIDDDGDQLVADGQPVHYSIKGRHVSMTLARSILSIEDASPLPPSPRNVVALDAQYDQVVPESWVVIERPDRLIVSQALATQTVSKAEYGLTGKVTQLTLNHDWLRPEDLMLSLFRQTTVYAQSEALTLAEEPIDDDVCGDTVELGRLYDGLQSGRWIIVSGERTDIPNTTGVKASERVMLAGVRQDFKPALAGDAVHSTLILADSLAYTYKRDTVTIYANVVAATHGETRNEVLGSGDGSKALQQFTLKQSPLTYTSAPNPSGVDSTLQARVNDILWHETDSLAGLGRNDRSYVTRADDEAKTTLIFGNGDHGARLPTGAENVRATYRSGIGKPGNVKAEQISLLATRPLGVKAVINPIRASGGADKESRDQARRNTPLATLALDRLVSVQDYADFARTFAGIGQASAIHLSDGRRQVVHVTIAGADDIPIDTTSDLFVNLGQALRQFGDPYQPLQVAVRELLVLVIGADVRLKPDYQWESVAPKIRAELLDAFSFEKRDLGRSAFLGEAISVIQGVEGVAYVDVNVFDSISETESADAKLLKQKLEKLQNASRPEPAVRAQLARLGVQAGVLPAQLAFLTPAVPDTLILKELTA